MEMIDQKILIWINSLAGRFHWLDSIGIFLAVFGIYILVVWGIWLYSDKKLRLNVYVALASALVSRAVIVQVIKVLVNRPRPFETLRVHLLLHDSGTGEAFSSGHAVVMYAIAFSFYGTRWFWPMFVLATISSLARVFVGVHYPGDIFASLVIAAGTVWAFRRLFKRLKLR